MKFTTVSKIPNTSQMLIIPFLSMYYIYTVSTQNLLYGSVSTIFTKAHKLIPWIAWFIYFCIICCMLPLLQSVPPTTK